jgi:hypothetical protein
VIACYVGVQAEGAYPIYAAIWAEGVLTIYGTTGHKVTYYARRL